MEPIGRKNTSHKERREEARTKRKETRAQRDSIKAAKERAKVDRAKTKTEMKVAKEKAKLDRVKNGQYAHHISVGVYRSAPSDKKTTEKTRSKTTPNRSRGDVRSIKTPLNAKKTTPNSRKGATKKTKGSTSKVKTDNRRLTDVEVQKELSELNRSPVGMRIDKHIEAKKTFPKNPTRSQMDRYLKNPNRYDIRGHDTPGLTERANTEMRRKETLNKTIHEGKRAHDEIRPYLKDIRHDEVAKNSRWKYDDNEAIIAYERSMWDQEKMLSGAYRKSPRKSKIKKRRK